MELSPAPRQTPFGRIPPEWGLKRLGQLYEFSNGVNADKRAYGHGMRFVNVLEPITFSHLYGPEIPGRVSLPGSIAASYVVRQGDVLFNRTSETDNELGLACVYLGEKSVVFGGFVIRGRPIDSSLDSAYAGYALRAPGIRAQIIPLGQGAVRANIGQEQLRGVVVPIPPLAEQQAIAAALSDVDDLIGGLTRLIAKKRDLKQGAMQQLLTGRTRLPGFRGGWQVKRLEELGTWKGGMTPSMRNPGFWDGGDMPWISSGDVKTQRLSRTTAAITRAAVQSGASTMVPAGCVVLVVRSGILRRQLPVALTEVPMAINQDIKALLPSADASADFVLHSLTFHGASILSSCLKTGTTVESIEFRWLKAFTIRIPPTTTEQIAIATVLSDMDAELAALETRRAKTQALKQAMMQSLLTGRIRLVAREPAHVRTLSR